MHSRAGWSRFQAHGYVFPWCIQGGQRTKSAQQIILSLCRATQQWMHSHAHSNAALHKLFLSITKEEMAMHPEHLNCNLQYSTFWKNQLMHFESRSLHAPSIHGQQAKITQIFSKSSLGLFWVTLGYYEHQKDRKGGGWVILGAQKTLGGGSK